MALGLLGSAIAGGLAGLGEGMSNLAGKYIDRETEQLKLQRLQEFKERDAALDDAYAARKEQRGLLNDAALYKAKKDIDTDPAYAQRELDAKKRAAQAEIDLKTDPGNVDKQTEAKLRGQKAEDAYKDARFDKDLEHARLEHEAKNPYEKAEFEAKMKNYESEINKRLADTKDQGEKRALEQQKAVLDGLKYRFGEAGKRLKDIDDQLATGLSDDEGSLVALREEKQRVLSEYQALDGQLKAFLGEGEGEGQAPKGGRLDPKTHPVVGGAQAKLMGDGGKANARPDGMLPVANQTPKQAEQKPAQEEKPGKITHPSGILSDDQAKAYGGLSEGHKALMNDMGLTDLDTKAMARLALIPVKTARMWGRDVLLKVLATGNFPDTGNRVG